MDEIIYDYLPPVSELLKLGDPRDRLGQIDYLKLGLTEAHVPDLIRMFQDDDLHWADGESQEVWAPLHAWRALGDLRAESAIEPLVALLPRIDEYDDDWVMEDLPDVFAQLGEPAVGALVLFLLDDRHGLWSRVTAASSLGKIGQAHPEARDMCVAALVITLKHFDTQDEDLNGFIISALVDLKAVDAAPMMEQAFEADKVDMSLLGDWEDVQILLGLLDKRLTPPPEYTWLPEPEIRELEQAKVKNKAEVRTKREVKAKKKTKRKQAKKSRKKQRRRK